MIEKFEMEEGDTDTPLRVRLKDRNGYADLTASVVVLDVTPIHRSNKVVDGAACVPHADQTANGGHRGEVLHDWTQPEADALKRSVGFYEATWRVTKNGRTKTFPTGYVLIEVT